MFAKVLPSARLNPSPATLQVARPRCVQCHAAEPDVDASVTSPAVGEVGERLREWLASPFDFAAFGPRLTVGALLSAPDRIQSFGSELERVQELINSPAPPEEKSKQLASELEQCALYHLDNACITSARPMFVFQDFVSAIEDVPVHPG